MLRSLIPSRERPLFPVTDRFSRAVSRMEEEMEDLMERLFGVEQGWWTPTSTGFIPRANLAETENELEVTVDLPGLKPEEINVELRDGNLWISGERHEEKEEEGKSFHRIERRYGEFRRVLPLPTAVEEGKIEAKFEHGVLRITVPKAEEAKTKHIEVKQV